MDALFAPARASVSLNLSSWNTPAEGAAGTAIAGYLKQRETLRGCNVVVIVSGANIALDVLKTVL